MSLADERAHPSAMRFEILTRSDRGRHVVCPSGELDIATSDQLRLALDRALQGNVTGLVLDLTQVEFIDSTGIHTIISFSRQATERGKDFRLISGPPQVQRTLTLAGVTEHLPFTD